MNNRSPYTKGLITFIVLMVLTIAEYFVAAASSNPSAVLLILIAIAKAGLIMNIFMNITRLWRGEEEHH